MKTKIIRTYTLNNGREVFAKLDCEGILWPVTYANLTQCRKKVAELGPEWELHGYHPFFAAKKVL